MASEDRRELLESLLAHPGWTVFATSVQREAVTQALAQTKQAMAGATNEQKLWGVQVAHDRQEAAEWVLAWPTQEVQRLQRMETPIHERAPWTTRRGRL